MPDMGGPTVHAKHGMEYSVKLLAHALYLGAERVYLVQCITQDTTILVWKYDAPELLNWDTNALPCYRDMYSQGTTPVLAHALSLGADDWYPVRCITQDTTILVWTYDAPELLN